MTTDIAADAVFSAGIKPFEEWQIFDRTDRVGQAQLQTAGKNGLPTDIDIFFALYDHFIKIEITPPATVIQVKCDDLAFFGVERVVRGIPDNPGTRTGKIALTANFAKGVHSSTIDFVEGVIFKSVQHKSR